MANVRMCQCSSLPGAGCDEGGSYPFGQAVLGQFGSEVGFVQINKVLVLSGRMVWTSEGATVR